MKKNECVTTLRVHRSTYHMIFIKLQGARLLIALSVFLLIAPSFVTKCYGANPTQMYLLSCLDEDTVFPQGIHNDRSTYLPDVNALLFFRSLSGLILTTSRHEVARSVAERLTCASGHIYLYEVNADNTYYNLHLSVLHYLQTADLTDPRYQRYAQQLTFFLPETQYEDLWITDRNIAAEDVLSVQIFSRNLPPIGYTNPRGRRTDLWASDDAYPISRISPFHPIVQENEPLLVMAIAGFIIPRRFNPDSRLTAGVSQSCDVALTSTDMAELLFLNHD